MRSLTPEEAELWAKVAATIRPLSREPKPPFHPENLRGKAHAPGGPARPDAMPQAARAPRQQTLPSATLDSGWDRRLRSGSVEPDRVLDLHGRNLDQAWRAIDDALERAIAAGERVMLLITGHPRTGDPSVGRGKIRAAVYDWLAASPRAGAIAAVRPAHRRHGGTGSLYIILRRNRGSSTIS